MTDRDRDERPWKPVDDYRPPPKGNREHQTGDAEPVHGPDDPLAPPGTERTT